MSEPIEIIEGAVKRKKGEIIAFSIIAVFLFAMVMWAFAGLATTHPVVPLTPLTDCHNGWTISLFGNTWLYDLDDNGAPIRCMKV